MEFEFDLGNGGGTVGDYPLENNDIYTLDGNGSLPLQSDNTTQSPAGNYNQLGSGGSPGGVLGSVATELQNLPTQALQLGTLVGNAQRYLAQVKANYSGAKTAASSGNSLATWWLYASTTDKLMVGLGVATLAWMMTHEG